MNALTHRISVGKIRLLLAKPKRGPEKPTVTAQRQFGPAENDWSPAATFTTDELPLLAQAVQMMRDYLEGPPPKPNGSKPPGTPPQASAPPAAAPSQPPERPPFVPTSPPSRLTVPAQSSSAKRWRVTAAAQHVGPARRSSQRGADVIKATTAARRRSR